MNKRFISIEGGEGCGKTTVIQSIKKFFMENGVDAKFFREPGGTEAGEIIRNILKSQDYKLNLKAEALLFAAARAQNMEENVMPALKEGHIVIADRFIDSSIVYQGKARGLGEQAVRAINEFAIDNLYPSLTIFLDMGPGKEYGRKETPDENDTFEQAGRQFHKDVRDGYVELAKKEARFKVINANQSREAVFSDVIKAISNHLEMDFNKEDIVER